MGGKIDIRVAAAIARSAGATADRELAAQIRRLAAGQPAYSGYAGAPWPTRRRCRRRSLPGRCCGGWPAPRVGSKVDRPDR